MNCEVYSSFSHTIAFLKDNDVWVDSSIMTLCPTTATRTSERTGPLDTMDWSVFNGLSPEEY